MDLINLSVTDWGMGAVLLLLLLYKLGTWNFDHFSSRGIKTCKVVPFMGSMAGTVLKRKSLAHHIIDVYREFKDETVVGMFQFLTPVLVIKDPELIKLITVKDFEHFTDHVEVVPVDCDTLLGNSLMGLKGQRWHSMRGTLSPVFTSSKMKNMFNFMNQCGQQLADYLHNEINKQRPGEPYTVELRDLFTRFTIDVIATSAFGVHVDSMKEKENSFYQMGKQIANFSGTKHFKLFGYFFSPKLMKLLGITLFNKKEKDFFIDLVHNTITTRKREGIIRPDLIHLLMEACNEDASEQDGARKRDITEDVIVSQALIFFLAGFHPTAILLSFTSILIAMHDDVQKKLLEEIDVILGSDSALTYENLQKMKYLDMVLSEVQRLYPSAISTDRVCTKEYTIPATDNRPAYTIKKGEAIMLPMFGIHRDPEYYPNPEVFDPERFNDDNKQSMVPYTYFPFGVGPRICIGQRFALLEVKVALVHLLRHFQLRVSQKTTLPLELDPSNIMLSLKGGFWANIERRTAEDK